MTHELVRHTTDNNLVVEPLQVKQPVFMTKLHNQQNSSEVFSLLSVKLLSYKYSDITVDAMAYSHYYCQQH